MLSLFDPPFETFHISNFPPKSRLYHLAPIGVGTPYVESFSGYVARLADKHSTTLYYLFSEEVAPLISKPGTISLSVSFTSFAKAVNGLGVIAADLVEVFERLTLRRDLRFTTMLPWAVSISSKSLTRKARAWCPECYEENAGGEVYDQLLWSIQGMTSCAKHGRKLEHECPYCGRRQVPLSHRLRPGFCARCQAWLGRLPRRKTNAESPQPVETTGEELRITEEVGKLLEVAPKIAGSGVSFAEKLRGHVEKMFMGRGVPSKTELPASKTTLRCWLGGTQKPSLALLLETCFALDLSPADLLLGHAGDTSVTGAGTAEYAKSGATHLRGCKEAISAAPRINWKDGESVARVEERLRAALMDSPPTSLTKVAKELKCTRGTLRKKFPGLAAQLAERAYDYYRPAVDDEIILKALRDAAEETPPPPLQEVSRKLGGGASVTTLRKKFPAESSRVVENYSAHGKRHLDDDAIERQLRAALKRDPPPSLRDVSREIGVAGPTLYRKFPALTKAISTRSAVYRREENARRREMIKAEIRAICERTLRAGLYPSDVLVRAHLTVPCRSQTFSIIRREVLAELGISSALSN